MTRWLLMTPSWFDAYHWNHSLDDNHHWITICPFSVVCVRYWVTLGILSILTLSFDPLSRWDVMVWSGSCWSSCQYNFQSKVHEGFSIELQTHIARVLPGYFLAKGVLLLWSIYTTQQPINWGCFWNHCTPLMAQKRHTGFANLTLVLFRCGL